MESAVTLALCRQHAHHRGAVVEAAELSLGARDLAVGIASDEARGLHRPTNRAGGIEGGVSNGEEIRIQAVVKPIPTLTKPLRSVDLRTLEPRAASIERSDTCVVPAAGVVCEAAVAWVLADALLEKFGGDSLGELMRNLEAARARRAPLPART